MQGRLLSIMALAMGAALAACGGGSTGGPIPNPGPSGTPAVTPSPTPTPTLAPQSQVHYSWQGALAPSGGTQTFATFVQPMATGSATPIPVQATLCDPRSADCRPAGQQTALNTAQNPTLDISDGASPSPSAPPTVSPPPGWSMALQKSASPNFTYQANTPTQAGCGNIGVTFPNATGTVRQCSYAVFTIGCVPSLSYQPGGGYSTAVQAGYSFDTKSYVTDPTQADVYMTGQTCPGSMYATNTGPLDYEVYFPHGAIALPETSNTLATVSPTQWVNSMTQIEYNDGVNPGTTCGGQLSCIVLVKTASGNIAEFQMIWGGSDGPNDLAYHGDWFTAAYATATSGSFPQ